MGLKQFLHHQGLAFKSAFSTSNSTFIQNIRTWNSIEFNLLSMDNKIKLFKENPTLMAGLTKMSRLFSSATFEVVGKDNKPIESDPLKDLLKKPNFFQSKEEYLTQWLILTILDGGSISIPFAPTGFNDNVKRVEGLMNCPMSSATMTDVRFSNYQNYKEQVEKAKVNLVINGQSTTYDYNELIPMYDIGLNSNTSNLLQPFSRLSSLKWSLSNIQTANESANVMADNPAGLGIISTGSKVAGEQIPLNPDQKKELDKQFEGHGLTHNKRKFITSLATLDYKSTLNKYQDLGLKEIKESGDLDVIRVLDIPKELFSVDASKYENHKVIELAWIQGSIQNMMDSFVSNLNNYFGYGLGLNGKYLRARYDHLPCFSEKRKETAQTLKLTAEALKISKDAGLMNDEEAIKIMKDLTGISYE